ncbi:MAG: hypothetical protein ACRDID_03570 [Ktedonobacterales bacterium]
MALNDSLVRLVDHLARQRDEVRELAQDTALALRCSVVGLVGKRLGAQHIAYPLGLPQR